MTKPIYNELGIGKEDKEYLSAYTSKFVIEMIKNRGKINTFNTLFLDRKEYTMKNLCILLVMNSGLTEE